MITRLLLALCLLSAPALADEIEVKGCDAKFPTTREATIGATAYQLKLTGAGLREKMFVNVYAIASYRDATAQVNGAGSLIRADIAKQLILRMERDVDGDSMYEALEKSIFKNGGEGKFKDELSKFKAYFVKNNAKKGKEIIFTHVPGKGLSCQIDQAAPLDIDNLDFAKATWSIWFGAKPADKGVKKALLKQGS
ncbi:chalcone isomerase family protein [Myxococcota bacterium]|nr:chalcone isomerase family protein [Myxococcota bacterium]MBU1430182.1 chalcone isomerase family protein [Myxococcota bacterium]MBU1898596.1 chalcone isomerase family protein [Myxococcota bacterium]